MAKVNEEKVWLVVGSRESVPRREMLATADRTQAERSLEWHRQHALGLTRYWIEEQTTAGEKC